MVFMKLPLNTVILFLSNGESVVTEHGERVEWQAPSALMFTVYCLLEHGNLNN